MKRDQSAIAAPGAGIAPRKNIGAGSRALSVVTGAALGVAASRQKGGVAAALGLVSSLLVARGVSGMAPVGRLVSQTPEERAYAKQAGWSSAAVVGRSVTINAPASKVYARLRDFAAWPDFSVNVLEVESLGKGSYKWTAMNPSGPVTLKASIIEEIPDQRLLINADPRTPVPINSRFELRDAPGGRGTELHVAMWYRPPGGSLARYASKLTQREPGIQLRRDLKRLKSLIETGEIATNLPQGGKIKA